jgi:UDPglucose 6-dehydrogenase/GDP-mannose 6-dehydrogenase
MKGVHLARYFTTPQSGGESVTAPITSFLLAGCGFGGSCLPKDVKALVAQGEGVGARMPLLTAVLDINRDQPNRVIEIVESRFPSLAGLKATILGLAFKPDTDDMRESPAIPIIKALLERGANVCAYDAAAIDAAKKVLPEGRVRFVPDLQSALTNIDFAIIVTSWGEFQKLPEIVSNMKAPPLVIVREDLDKALDRFEEVVSELAKMPRPASVAA